MKKLKGTVSHRERVIEDLRADPKLARAYLLVAMEDEDSRVFLTALRNVAEARGMARIVQAAGVRRESLYRTLSPTGNPDCRRFVPYSKPRVFACPCKRRSPCVIGRHSGAIRNTEVDYHQ